MAYEIFVILVPFVIMSTQGPKDLLFKVVHRAANHSVACCHEGIAQSVVLDFVHSVVGLKAARERREPVVHELDGHHDSSSFFNISAIFPSSKNSSGLMLSPRRFLPRKLVMLEDKL